MSCLLDVIMVCDGPAPWRMCHARVDVCLKLLPIMVSPDGISGCMHHLIEKAKCALGGCVVRWKGHGFEDRKIWFEFSFTTFKYVPIGQLFRYTEPQIPHLWSKTESPVLSFVTA